MKSTRFGKNLGFLHVKTFGATDMQTIEIKRKPLEIKDFVKIQKELEQISITVETLQLWSEQMLANNSIDIDLYNKYKNEL